MVLLPVEYNLSKAKTHKISIWKRVFSLPAKAEDHEKLSIDVVCVSRYPHEDEISSKSLPPTIDVYLPGLIGWEDYLERLKFEKAQSKTAHIDDLVCSLLLPPTV